MANPTQPVQPQNSKPQPTSEPTPQPQSAPEPAPKPQSPTPQPNPESVPPLPKPKPQAAAEPAPQPQPAPEAVPPPQKPKPQPAPGPALPPQEPVKVVTRFATLQRIEHLILLISFTTLAVTGLPQKFSTAPFSEFVINLFGGIESIRVVHRIAAVILMVLSIYHVVAVLYRVLVRRVPWTMMPVVEDFKHLWHDMLFYFGRRKHKAYYGRYNYAEKAEYLAVVWGTLIMIITGFMMWNPIATTNFLPGQFIPAAKVAHGGEALLAVLAIILWHFYHVHLRHLNKSIFTGKMTRHEMEEEHPAELALIEAGRAAQEPPPVVLRRRRQIFYPIASVIVVVSGLLLLGFITFEKTAIETVPPPITGEAFVPYTPTPTLAPSPTPVAAATPAAVGSASWDTTISTLLNAKCAACHVNSVLGGLSLKTYADALKGGKGGPAIVPNDPAQSVLVQIQQKGGHAGQLDAVELEQVIAWIETGAPEKSGATTTPPTTAGAEGWTGGIDQLVNAKCAGCHVSTAAADLSLKTYAAALKGGQSGPAVVPNDPAKSVLVQVQQKGGHPGQFTPEEIDRIVKWIEAGAPEVAGSGSAGATPAPGIKVKSWADAFAIFTAKCTMCHINVQAGNLSLKTYQDALKGGQSGPAIVPGNPDTSVLVTTQQGTDHPSLGRLTPEELAALIAWIKAGAPEVDRKTWATVSVIFTAKCTMCHINVQAGNLSLKTYADALKGGQSGPAIVPGDPAKSVLVTTQQGTDHPSLGRLTPEELADIIAWIEAGAPEE